MSLQFFGEFGIRVTGFGFYEKTWCVLIACPDAIDDDLLENLVNAAWQAAVGESAHPLKKAVARVKRWLDCERQTDSAGGENTDQDCVPSSEIHAPKAGAAISKKFKNRRKDRNRARGRNLVRSSLG